MMKRKKTKKEVVVPLLEAKKPVNATRMSIYEKLTKRSIPLKKASGTSNALKKDRDSRMVKALESNILVAATPQKKVKRF
jgi:hypothetical protein